MDNATTVDEYIQSFPDAVQDILQEVRRTIHAAVPDAGEKISYDIPTITLDGRYVVYFAAWKDHISVYPLPQMDDDLQREIAPLTSGKGTVRFPLDRPVPYDLIARLASMLAQQRRRGGR